DADPPDESNTNNKTRNQNLLHGPYPPTPPATLRASSLQLFPRHQGDCNPEPLKPQDTTICRTETPRTT
ncbi:Hypothetical predicted protein, partial [Pelobates cultripes]